MSVFRDAPELLRGYREGRREALERVYRHYVRIVERQLRAFASASNDATMGAADVVADLVQDVFIRAFSRGARESYDGVRDFGPYLTTIARNCFLDTVRSRRKLTTRDWNELADALEGAPEPPEPWCEPKTFAVLTAYIKTLPDGLRALYEQRFVLGKSQEEASAALRLSRRALRTGENRLRKGLRKALVRAGISLQELGDSPRAADFPTKIASATVVSRSRP